MKANDWQKRFGAKRRAIDKAILAECERQIALEERRGDGAGGPKADSRSPTPPKPGTAASEARNAIARAFGRPLN